MEHEGVKEGKRDRKTSRVRERRQEHDIHVYIYIYREREREGGKQGDNAKLLQNMGIRVPKSQKGGRKTGRDGHQAK